MKRQFDSLEEELKYLSLKTFNILELVEVAGIKGESFNLIRRRLLNLANDILRLEDKSKEGGNNV